MAYDILSSSSSKHAYDTKLRSRSTTRTPDVDAEEDIFATARPAQHANDTFYGVLAAVFADFMEGDFEMIRTFLSAYICAPSSNYITESVLAGALNEVNPALNMGEESVESLINSFRALRELILGTFSYSIL